MRDMTHELAARISVEARERERALYRDRAPREEGWSDVEAAVAAWSRHVAALGGPLGDRELTAARAQTVGRDVASLLHTRFHAAAAAGRPASLEIREVIRGEIAYRARLADLRRAAAAGDRRRVAGALGLVFGPDAARAQALCAASGAADVAIGLGAGRVRVSLLARRLAALAAGAVWLQHRLATPRLRAGTARIAANRPTLTREHPQVLVSAVGFAGLDPGTRMQVIGHVLDVTWVERPARPYTRIALRDESEIRVHFRNLQRNGLGGGQWVCARVKVEEPDGAPYAVAELEGPSNGEATVWEDWLQVQARDSYDIAPRSVDLVSDFPDPSRPGAALDLYARTTGGAD